MIISLIVTLICGFIASGLTFDSSYEALLPEGAPEVKNGDEVRDRTGGTRELVIAISGKDEKKRLEYARTLRPDLQKISGIRCVDLEFPADFFKDRGFWLMDIARLDTLIPALENAIALAKNHANPMALHLDEEAEEAELSAGWKKVSNIAEVQQTGIPLDGVLRSKDGRFTFLLVVPTIKFSDMAAGNRLLGDIRHAVDNHPPAAQGLSVRYAGPLDILQEQHQVMSRDMKLSSLLSLVFCIAIVAGFSRQLRAPFLIGAALVAGVIWTFAIARLLVGHVNIITGFLVSVLIGLGIDFGVHLFIRFQQELKKPGTTFDEAIVRFVIGTASPAFTAAMTTAGVFFSFVIADFRGFSEFGLLAGIGVVLTLSSAFIILPPIIVVTYRKKWQTSLPAASPIISNRKGWLEKKSVAICIILATLVMTVVGVYGSFHIPFRNNFRELRGTSPATEFFDYVNENIGTGFNPAVFITSSVADAKHAEEILLHIRDNGYNNGKPSNIARVMSASHLLPQDIPEHRQRIERLKEILWDTKLDRATEKKTPESEKLITARNMVNTEPWEMKDVPEVFRRRFTTVDATPSYLTYAWPRVQNDADYRATAWSDELDSASAELNKRGISHLKADETLIIAWIYKLIKKDGPSLLLLSILVVIIFVAIDFKRPRKVLLLLVPLVSGVFTFLGIAHLLGMELNMFNLIVVPSIIGIGIDNAVHILHRYEKEGPGTVWFVVKNTGVAAFLASVTTSAGFGTAMISHNLGLKSMGAMAVIGIMSTFVAAVIFFPAILTLIEPWKTKRP